MAILRSLKTKLEGGARPDRVAGYQDLTLFITSCALATILSTVNPECFMRSLIGADAPKSSRATTIPSFPTYSFQPRLVPASTATRARTPDGSTWILYSDDCFSKSSQQGMETTRAFTPSAVSFS